MRYAQYAFDHSHSRRRRLLSAVLLAPALASAQTPTFAKDVAPIFYAKCVECHRPTMFAPMSLVKFDEARPWAKSIRNRVATRTMPPWGADPAARRLQERSAAERQGDRDDPRVGRRRRAEGRRQGPAQAAAVRRGLDDRQARRRVRNDRRPFQIPATGTVEYQYLRIPTNITEDKWLAAIEIKPQARAQVHHVIAFTQPAGAPINRERRARPGQHRRRHAEQARRGLRSGRRPPADRQLRHRPADALHDQRPGHDRQDAWSACDS